MPNECQNGTERVPKVALGVLNGTQNGTSAKPNGTISAKVSSNPDIIRAEMKARLDAGQTFIPNWYRNGFKSRNETMDYVIDLVNNSDKVKKQALI